MDEQAPVVFKVPEDALRTLLRANLRVGKTFTLEFDRERTWARSEWEGKSCYRHTLVVTTEVNAREQTYFTLFSVNTFGDLLGVDLFDAGGNVHRYTRQDG